MDLKNTILIMSFSAPVFSALFCIVLLLFKLNKTDTVQLRRLIRLLVFFYTLLGLFFIIMALYYFNRMAYLYMVSIDFLSSLLLPVMLYHIIFKLTRVRKQEPFPILHYVFPVILYIVHTLWLTFIPLDVKLLLVEKRVFFVEEYEWFSAFDSFRFFIRAVIGIFYLLLSVKRTRKYQENIINYSADIGQTSLRWVYQIFLCIIILLPVPLLYYFSKSGSTTEYLLIILPNFFTIFLNVVMCYNIFTNNFILLTEDIVIRQFKAKDKDKDNSKTNIDRQRFEKYIQEKKPYLEPKLKITDLTLELGTNRSYLSAFINTNYNMNFSAYINKCRIAELEIMREDPAYADLPEIELIYLSGFSNYRGYKRTKELFETVS